MGHLLNSPAQMEKHLLIQTARRTASQIVCHIYHNQHINRLFTKNYIEYIQKSIDNYLNIWKIGLTYAPYIVMGTGPFAQRGQGKIRVGSVSPYFVIGLYMNHDTGQFEIFSYLLQRYCF